MYTYVYVCLYTYTGIYMCAHIYINGDAQVFDFSPLFFSFVGGIKPDLVTLDTLNFTRPEHTNLSHRLLRVSASGEQNAFLLKVLGDRWLFWICTNILLA